MAFEDYWFSKTEEPVGATLRFSGGQFLSRTPPAAGNRTKWTWSAWVKRSTLSTPLAQEMFGAYSGPTADGFYWNNTNSLFYANVSTVRESSALYRDPSGWYHLVGVWDSGNAVAADRSILYVNGVRLTAFSSSAAVSLNQQSAYINTTNEHTIGYQSAANQQYFFGYQSDVFFVDSQALLPTTFGQFAANGVWEPFEFATSKQNVITAGGFGTTGFALRFESQYFNSGTLVWADQSGNGNNWTANWNCATGAGAGTDIMLDAPTFNYATNNGVGFSNTRPLLSLFNGNLIANNSAPTEQQSASTMLLTGGKWYFEYTSSNAGGIVNTTQYVGVTQPEPPPFFNPGNTQNWCLETWSGNKIHAGAVTGYAPGSGSGPVGIIGCAIDLDNNKIWWSRGGVFPGGGNPAAGTGAAFTNVVGPVVVSNQTGGGNPGAVFSQNYNFGQRAYTYTPPAGFESMAGSNGPAATIPDGSTGFQAVLDTGANILTTAQATFPNGLWWVKDRVNTNQGQLVDSVRGAGLAMRTPAGGSEVAYVTPTGNSVAWCWSAPSAFSNSTGTIPVTGSRNTSTGFSIVTYTGTGAPSTYGHGLPAAPDFVISLALDAIGAVDICVWHRYFQSPQTTGDKNMLLSSTSGLISGSQAYPSPPDSSFVYLDNATGTNNPAGSRFAAYQWCAISGYSKFGNYTGNSSTDGPFVYTGFKPALVILKSVSTSGNWYQYDNARNTYNPETLVLQASQTSGDITVNGVDFLSNGFKIRTTDGNVNTSGQSYIYAAFAENPFGGSNVAPVTAR